MTRNPASGIRLTSHRRMACVSCREGKQTRNAQPKQDSGEKEPIDRIGGEICSDMKGLMTPQYRLENRYLISFVDHKSNYCGIFLARTKDAAAKQFEAFLTHFENRFDCGSTCFAPTAAASTPTWTFSTSALKWRADLGGEEPNVERECGAYAPHGFQPRAKHHVSLRAAT
uniref:Integrase catalytic domain-containing protein n=1 Tax=Peronospora matthiolae TaxID=2874970 RepID=A0AAV1TA52_9STRA